MSVLSVSSTLTTAATAGTIMAVPSTPQLPLTATAIVPPYSFIYATMTGTLVGSWSVQASANAFETFTVLGTYTAAQTQIALQLPNPPPAQNFQVRWYCNSYTSGTAVCTLALPAVQYANFAASGGGTVVVEDDYGIQVGQLIALTQISYGLTAHAGGTQAAGLLLTSQNNIVTTVGSAADSVLLPVVGTNGVQLGTVIQITNLAAANSLQVYGSGTDQINNAATATGVALAASHSGWYQVVKLGTANTWIGWSAGAA